MNKASVPSKSSTQTESSQTSGATLSKERQDLPKPPSKRCHPEDKAEDLQASDENSENEAKRLKREHASFQKFMRRNLAVPPTLPYSVPTPQDVARQDSFRQHGLEEATTLVKNLLLRQQKLLVTMVFKEIHYHEEAGVDNWDPVEWHSDSHMDRYEVHNTYMDRLQTSA
ncbi:hypothetical protein BGX28_001487, partial [Mortierella sp. GBA30]